jgi:hypothetical protein
MATSEISLGGSWLMAAMLHDGRRGAGRLWARIAPAAASHRSPSAPPPALAAPDVGAERVEQAAHTEGEEGDEGDEHEAILLWQVWTGQRPVCMSI